MDKSIFTVKRKNYIASGEIFFWTATINKWQRLLWKDEYKDIIVSSLQYLSEAGKIDVFAFVIMPNHMHLVWQLLQPNGRESPVASLMKFTGHHFEKHLRQNNPKDLLQYAVDWRCRKFNFWQPEPDWFLLLKERTTAQKLTYIHCNPLQGKWKLVENPVDYFYSSARFYETGKSEFSFLYDYRDYDDKPF